MDDVTLIKYLAGTDPRGIPNEDYPRSPENSNPGGKPNADESEGRQSVYDQDTRPERGDRNDNDSQTRWPSDI